MLKALRTRLLLSYTLILVVTLAVMSIALLFVLRGRTKPSDQISQRLASLAEGVQSRPEMALSPEGLSRQQERLLNVTVRTLRFRNLGVRLLVMRADGTVNYDSMDQFAPGQKANWKPDDYTPPPTTTTGPEGIVITDQSGKFTRGNMRTPDGSDWFFVALTAQPTGVQPGPNPFQFVIAIPAPRALTLAQLFQFYGDDLFLPLLQAGIFGLSAAVFLSLVMARSVARPLQDVARAAEGIARGDLAHRAPLSGPNEARTVAEAFNKMADEVAHTQQVQREFLANVTHDLRTPLTSIQGFSQAIIEGVASDRAANVRAAQIIYDEAARMSRMVEELLDLARIEAGRWNMTKHTVQLGDLLGAVGERLTPKANDRGLRLVVELMPLPPIAGDGDRLVQVFTNLIDNAIKHTPSGGMVTLRTLLSEGGVLSMVSDTGEGIPAEDLPHVFDRFYQVDKSRQREKREGAGLGLTITKQIVEAHGGKIWAESAEGEGTTMYVWLPAPLSDASTIIRRRPVKRGVETLPAPTRP